MKTKSELWALGAVAIALSCAGNVSDAAASLDLETERIIDIHTDENFPDVWVKAIARAWSDEEFKQELLENPAKALEKHFNYRVPPGVRLRVVEGRRAEVGQFTLTLPAKPATIRTGTLIRDPDGRVLAVSRLQEGPLFLFPC